MTDPLTEPFASLCSALRGVRDQVQELVRVHESIEVFNVAFGDFQNAMALHASCLQFPKAPPTKKVSIQLSGIPAPQTSGLSLIRRSSRESAESNSSLNAGTSSGGGGASGKNRSSSVGSKGKKSLSMGGTGSSGGGSSGSGSTQQKRAQGKPGQQQQQQKNKRKAPVVVKKPESPAWKWDKRKDIRAIATNEYIRDQIPRKYQSKEELKKLENILLYIKNRGSGITIADLVKHSGLAVIKSKEILQTLMKLELIHRDHEKSGFVYTFGSAH